ncbi:MAG: putative NADH-flavin reductase [Gemmatimonadetes bacterium]|nr:putative NADH-flavin reductase [Gemmatimonadota bacterium]
MPSLVILGAGGFLGRTMVAESRSSLPIKAVARSIPRDRKPERPGVTWIEADLMDPGSIDSVLEDGDVVVNLAYMPYASAADNLRLIDNVVDASLRTGACRLVHCSTAVVVGASQAARVDETTPCRPATSYERSKWAVEQHVCAAVARGLDVAIVRPTAIIGPGGQNLLSLSRSIRQAPRIISYARACLFGARPMHLVPVRDVAAALLHVAMLPGALAGEVFIASSDDDSSNNFRSVEVILTEALALPRRTLPLLLLPTGMLSLLLRLRGRSETRLDRTYAHEKLRATGFRPVDTIAAVVREFGESVRETS